MRYRILGATEAHDDQGVTVPLGGPRLRALLAALALRPGRTTATEVLIDEVWADDPPHDAPAALQALVARLRRALGREAVASEPGGYRLTADPDDIDLHRFERLARTGTEALAAGDAESAARTLGEALSLWRGPALADLPDRTAATRPEARRLDVTRARIEAELRLGRPGDVVPELRELTEAHPYDEPLRAQLIRGLRDSGRGADALAAYESVRRTLAEGLGADPGPELRALHAELLAEPDSDLDRSAPSDRQRDTAHVHPDAHRGDVRPDAHRGSERPDALRGGQRPEKPAPPGGERPEEPGGERPEEPAPPGPGKEPAPPGPGKEPAPPGPGGERERPDAPRGGNLRPRLTSFVGREPELAAIRSDLHRARLVTLTGPGGSGKTRLAEETATGHPAPAWLAELAPLDHPEAVPGAVVSALGLRETVLMTSEHATAPDDPTALLVDYCAPRGLLLILDNCEHVIGAAARLAETLLTRCPELRILATSREPLGVPGESVRPVDPLPEDTAHRLFAERAAAVRPGFDPAEDPEAVAEICTRLDGLPLAIELAAARLRLLTPRQIADRLDDRFRLLTSGSRTVLPRQQTLRAVVDWSWDLLDERERTVLREVSVFAGGWDLPAAEAVCGPDAADLIGALVDKSLVVAAPVKRRRPGPGGAGMRYRLLETIHEYANERAAAAPEILVRARRRHIDHFVELVEEAEPLLRTAAQMPWIARLEGDLDNIRAVLQRTVEEGDEESAIAMALGVGWFWWLRNYRKEGAEWVERILPLGTDPEGPDAERDPRYWPRMRLRLAHLFLVAESGPIERLDDPEVRAGLVRIRDAFARPGPHATSFPGILWPFTQLVLEGPEGRRAALDLAVETCRKYGGPWEVGVSLMFRTHTAVDMSGMTGVDEDLAELRELSREVGDRWMRAQVCSAAGEAAMTRGQLEAAQAEYEEALQLAYEVGAHAEAPFLIARLAEIAYRTGDLSLAQRALAEAESEADRYGVADARSFVRILSAVFALERGEVERARARWREACEAAEQGTPPAQFEAALASLDGRITLVETSPRDALPKLVEALRLAVRGRCAEPLLASVAEATALALAALGDHERAARVLAAATHWRGGLPRSRQEQKEVTSLEEQLTKALGVPRYEKEQAAADTLTPENVLDDLTTTFT